LFPTVWTREGADQADVRALELAVAEAAGLAATAVDVTGALIKVQGIGLIDPISNWSMMGNPKAFLSPQDVRTTAATVKGRLAALLAHVEAAQTAELPAFSPAFMHPVLWSGAAAHWTSHQYRVAVREAAEGLTLHWKQRLGRNDVDDTPFWKQTLSAGDPEPGKPKLRPGDKDDKTTKSMRGGLEPFAKSLNNLATGLNLTVRSITTHKPRRTQRAGGNGTAGGVQLSRPTPGPVRDPDGRSVAGDALPDRVAPETRRLHGLLRPSHEDSSSAVVWGVVEAWSSHGAQHRRHAGDGSDSRSGHAS
jgi:hypothetical protein